MLSAKATRNLALWFLGFIALALLGALGYAVKTSWQNEARLTQLAQDNNARLSQLSADIQGLRRSMIRMLLKGSPADASIANELVSSASLQGIGQFKSGAFTAAYSTWSTAAAKGDKDATFAIASASAALKDKLKDPNLPAEDREAVEAALRSAPRVVESDGSLIYKGGN